MVSNPINLSIERLFVLKGVKRLFIRTDHDVRCTEGEGGALVKEIWGLVDDGNMRNKDRGGEEKG